MVVWVPYYCSAAVCCLSLPLLLLLLFLPVSIYVCLRVLVCLVIVEARRSVTRVGCRPPAPTLLCYYWRPCSGFNLHLAAFSNWLGRWDDGVESCAVLLCCAVLLLPFVLLVYASTEVTKNVVFLSESAPESYEQIAKYVLGQKSAQVLITLVVTSKIKPYRVYVVWVIIWAKSIAYIA